MTPRIRLEGQNLADLKLIRDLGEPKLRTVIAAVAQLPVAPLPPQTVQTEIAKSLRGEDGVSDILFRQVLSLHGLSRRLNLSTPQVFDGLDAALRPDQSGWTQEEFIGWQKISTVLRELFELPAVRLSAKALDLSYEHSHLLQHARIITDVRPIYDDPALRIEGCVISHKLLLRYDDLEGQHLLSLAVDDNDLDLLMGQCTRALQKAQTAKIQLDEKAGLKTLIPGKGMT